MPMRMRVVCIAVLSTHSLWLPLYTRLKARYPPMRAGRRRSRKGLTACEDEPRQVPCSNAPVCRTVRERYRSRAQVPQ